MSAATICVNMVLKVPIETIRQGKEVKIICIGKEVKFSLSAECLMLCTEPSSSFFNFNSHTGAVDSKLYILNHCLLCLLMNPE